MYFIYSDLQYIMPFGAIIILFNLVQFLFYALRRHYYFMRFSAILRTLERFIFYAPRRDYYFMRVSAILCTLERFIFYALRRDYYFMRVSAILCKAIFVIGRLLPR